jgi:hypothetical protein
VFVYLQRRKHEQLKLKIGCKTDAGANVGACALYVGFHVFAAAPAIVCFDQSAACALARVFKESSAVRADHCQLFDEWNVWSPSVAHAPSDPRKQALQVACFKVKKSICRKCCKGHAGDLCRCGQLQRRKQPAAKLG